MEENIVAGVGAALRKNLRRREGQFNVTLGDILAQMKRLLVLWIIVSVVLSLVVVSATAVVKQDAYQKLTAVISFTYDGVEKGLDPNGNKFYVNSIKGDEIIDEVMKNMNIPADQKDIIRRNITFEGVIPENAISRITSSNNLFDGKQSVSSTQSVSETTYYPTQYKVHFDYAATGLGNSQAADFINNMLKCYSQHFFNAYGYNKSLSKSLNAFNYIDYDYAEAIDVFDSSLTKLSTYITQVSSNDTTRFRSSETGYTFADLTEAIETIRERNLDTIDSYVSINSVTKDKETLLTYYMFRIESLQRHLTVCNETLASVNESINNYKKNTIMYFSQGDTQNQNDMTATITSQEYDDLFEKRQSIQNDLSSTAQQINLYNKRIERLNASTQANSSAQKAKVEEEISKLNTMIDDITNDVVKTTDDYYRTVVFPKAYNILTYASSSTLGVIKHAVKDSFSTVFILCAVIFAVYIAAAVVLAVNKEMIKLYGSSSKKKADVKKEAKAKS
ncbi:hypothetical protein [Ruminococcus sp. HUN007]|uniref:hypothetical protein n=1 Tax=Ruminococcus sp. HUN007 TaxID=1514668 RepID=UPI0005D1D97F|nr:hypothetical protein [Ruminococcus sp. HUN007]